MKYAILLLALIISACANPAPQEADPVNLPSLGFEAARIAAEVVVLF